jgi:hypothetical protein
VSVVFVLSVAFAVLGVAVSGAAAKRAKVRHPCSNLVTPFSLATPAPTSEPFDPSVVAMFAVLRRASGPDDVLPPINPLGEDLSYQLRSYYPAEIRQLAKDAEGERYFLVPGYPRVFPIPPERCLPKQVRHLHARLVAEQRQREIQPTFCIEDIGPHRRRYAGANCLPVSAIQTGEALLGATASRSDVVELAPDGVATVRLSYRTGEVISAPVSAGVYSFTPPQAPIKQAIKALRPLRLGGAHQSERQREKRARALFRRAEQLFLRLIPRTVQWLDAAGGTIRSFSPPSHGGGGAGLFSLLLAGEGASSVEGGLAISAG